MEKIFKMILLLSLFSLLVLNAGNITAVSHIKKTTTSKSYSVNNCKMKILSVSKKRIILKFTNNGICNFEYPMYFTLKKYKKGKWKKIDFKAKVPKELYTLERNSSIIKKIVWKKFFKVNLTKGKYKIKWIRTKEFKIK